MTSKPHMKKGKKMLGIETNKKAYTFKIEPELLDQARDKADLTLTPLSAAIRELIKKWVQDEVSIGKPSRKD